MASEENSTPSTSFKAAHDNIKIMSNNDATRRPSSLDDSKMYSKRASHHSPHSADSVMEHSCHHCIQDHSDQGGNNDEPLFLETTDPDAEASKMFVDSTIPEKEVFRGRAKFSGDKDEEEAQEKQERSSSSPPGFFNFSASEGGIFPLVIALPSSSKHSVGSWANRYRSQTSSSTPSQGDENESPAALSFVSILTMNEESSLMDIHGTVYTVPTRSIVHSDPNDDWEDLEEIIRPEFFEILQQHPVKKAIKTLGAEQLTSEDLSTSKSTPSTIRMTGETDSVLSRITSHLSIGKAREAIEISSDSSAGKVCRSYRPAIYSLSGATFICHGAEMDGSAERTLGRTLSPVLFTGSPASITREGSDLGEGSSYLSVQTPPNRRPGSETDCYWDADLLLDFVNSVRQAVSSANIAPDDVAQLETLIAQFLDEGLEVPCNVNIALINRSRFEKLLEELIDMKRPDSEYDILISRASELQRKWKRQFGVSFASIDEERFREMTTTGAFRGMFCSFANKTGRAMWMIDQNTSQVETDLNTGQWWPNVTCVCRDRWIKKLNGLSSIGRYGEPVLVLLNGEEEDGPTVGTYTYTFQSRAMFGPFGIISDSRKIFKVLRGHELKSAYAPKAGIRYDGEYKFESYGQTPRDHDTGQSGTFHLRLIRIEGEASVNFLHNIPTPAQMDEWKLCEKHAKGTQVEGRTHTFFKQLMGKMARSPETPSPKAARDMGESGFPASQLDSLT